MMEQETKKHNWPEEVRLKMIERSEFYQEPKVYQYGYYDGYQEALNQSPQPAASLQEAAKELSNITDEDIISVAKLFHEDYEWTIIENTKMNVVVECDDYRIFIWKTETDFIDFEERYKGEENIAAHGCESAPCSPYRSIIDIIDFLRYRGYNIPNNYGANWQASQSPAQSVVKAIKDYCGDSEYVPVEEILKIMATIYLLTPNE